MASNLETTRPVYVDSSTHARLKALARAVDRSMGSVVKILVWNVKTLGDLEPKHSTDLPVEEVTQCE